MSITSVQVVSSLIGGISHAPPRLRHPNQVEQSKNTQYSVRDGASKRPGTEYVADLSLQLAPSGVVPDNPYRMHAVNRDNTERYLIVYGNDDIDIYSELGVVQTTTIDAAALTYIQANTPNADELRLTTVADFTLILNTTVSIGAGDTFAPSYTVDRENAHEDYDVMTSYLPTTDSYHEAREVSLGGNPDGFYQYNVSSEDNGFANWKLTAGRLGGNWRQPRSNWALKKYNLAGGMGFRVRFGKRTLARTNMAYTHSDKTLTLSGAFADYEYVAGDEIYINADGDDTLPEGYWEVVSRTSDNAIVLSGTYRTTADALATALAENKGDSDCEYISTAHEVKINWTPEGPGGAGGGADLPVPNDLFGIAEALEAKLQATPQGSDGLINWQPTHAGWGAGDGVFQIVSPYRGTGASVINIHDPPDECISLADDDGNKPFKFLHGAAVAGTGTVPVTEVNDWISLGVVERWDQVPASGQDDAFIDETTMPHQIVRTTFGAPSTFNIDSIEWKKRLSGDSNSNPLLRPWNDTIKLADVTFYRNRLVLAGEELIVFSVDDDFFNFWVQDATAVADDDPIQLTISAESEVSLIDYVINWREKLFVTTKGEHQFLVDSTGDELKQDTVRASKSSSYKTLSIKPIGQEERMYLGSSDQHHGILFEYLFDELRASNVASDITSHVANLLPNEMRTIVTSRTSNRIFVLTNVCNFIYVYTSHWTGARKMQQAWDRWEFEDNYLIEDIAILDDDLFLLVKWTDCECPPVTKYVLEKVPASPLSELLETDCHPTYNVTEST